MNSKIKKIRIVKFFTIRKKFYYSQTKDFFKVLWCNIGDTMIAYLDMQIKY